MSAAPPYGPDANRIEHVWQDLHANVTRDHRCKTIERLLGNARRYLELRLEARRQARHRPGCLICSRIEIGHFRRAGRRAAPTPA